MNLKAFGVSNTKIKLDSLDWQEGTLGKPFKQIGLRKNGQMPEKYINGSYKSHWIYTFKYEDGKMFELEIDYNDKIIRKL